MIFEPTLGDPIHILPDHLLLFITRLQHKQPIDLPQFIVLLQAEPDYTLRHFVLTYIHENGLLSASLAVQFYFAFLSDPIALIRWHVILFLGLLGTPELLPHLHHFLTDPHELVRAATIWSMMKLDSKSLPTSSLIAELTLAMEDDRSRILLGAALYLHDASPTSQGMQFLAHYFTTNYYDISLNNFSSSVLLGPYGSSAEFFAALLWSIGLDLVKINSVSDLRLTWLLQRN